MSKAPTAAEKRHMDTLHTMPCVLCCPEWFIGMVGSAPNADYGYKGVEVDHLVDGYRLGHFFTIPLCHAHHEGKKGYGDKVWDSAKPEQWKLLISVYAVLGKPVPHYNPKGRNNFNPTN